MEKLYNIMYSKEYYTNLAADGNLSWCSVISCMFDSVEALENWQNMLHEVSIHRCERIKRVVRRAEASTLPMHEGFPNLALFLEEFDEKVIES